MKRNLMCKKENTYKAAFISLYDRLYIRDADTKYVNLWENKVTKSDIPDLSAVIICEKAICEAYPKHTYVAIKVGDKMREDLKEIKLND